VTAGNQQDIAAFNGSSAKRQGMTSVVPQESAK